ncbi:MAG: glycosyltransferase [Alphaproteobacteria bacterium]|nr:glycosyltransferase [Alphaproteobacteria bacterium]
MAEHDASGFRGYLERCDREIVAGWAFDADDPSCRVHLEIRCDGEIIGHVVADQYRGDLNDTGYLGTGHCAFTCAWPIPLAAHTPHRINVRRVSDGADLAGSPQVIPALAKFDDTAQAWFAGLLCDSATAVFTAEQLDDAVHFLLRQVDKLIAARARRDAGARATTLDPSRRWGGLIPSATIARTVAPLNPQALFIDEHHPVAADNAGANAALDHMRSLRRLGFEVFFTAADDPAHQERTVDALSARGIRVLTTPYYASVEEVLRRHAGRLDLIYLHRASVAAGYARLARRYCPEALLVYSVADLHFLRLARQGAIERRERTQQRARRALLDELTAARVCDVVITHSNAEADLLKRYVPGVTVAVVPWAVPISSTSTEFATRDGAVFIGNFAHSPNIDAIQFLATSILPWLRRKAPELRCRVVGSNMPEALYRMAQPGLEIVGPVDDVAAILAGARVSIAPLRYGAGLKGKVLESLAAGVPCIGTRIAYEGMQVPPALADCIVDKADAFAEAVIRLHGDPVAHATVAEAGRRHALVIYGAAAVDAQLRDVVMPVLRLWAGVSDTAVGVSAT